VLTVDKVPGTMDKTVDKVPGTKGKITVHQKKIGMLRGLTCLTRISTKGND
jgi:hypothetical protein